MSTSKQYNADSIKTLEIMDAIRKMPAMYIGSVDDEGVTVLAREAIDNSIDEAMNGHGSVINIVVNSQAEEPYISIEDFGRGIPVDPHPQHDGISTLEAVLTKAHTGGKFASEYGVTGGLHGTGLKAVTALSSWVIANVWRNGKKYTLEFVDSAVVTPLTEEKSVPAKRTGTAITFSPNPVYMKDATMMVPAKDVLIELLKERAYLNPNITLNLNYDGEEFTFKEDTGIGGYVQEMMDGKSIFKKQCFFPEADYNGVKVSFAIGWTGGVSRDNIIGYCNSIRQSEGGTHVQGLRMALPGVVRSYIEKNDVFSKKDSGIVIDAADCFEGTYGIVSIKHLSPSFRGQHKSKLSNGDAQGAVQRAINQSFTVWMEENPVEAKQICMRALSAAKARIAASKAREQVRKQDMNGTMGMRNFGKLADCESKDPSITELFIVEGDSAGGSAKASRDRKTQAVFPLKGKPKNTWESSQTDVLNNVELTDLSAAIGTGLFPEHASEEEIESQMSKLRYGKIVELADADIDGCFVGETMIMTTEGPRSFFHIAEVYRQTGYEFKGYALDSNGEQHVVDLRNPRCTKVTDEMVIVTAHPTLAEVCTPNHRWMLATGEFREAKDLKEGDVLAGGSETFPYGFPLTVLGVYHKIEERQSDHRPVYDLTVDKYHNFQLASGAFVHNSHIECLLLTHIYKHMRPLIERGHVYLGVPPLFRVTEKGKNSYLKDNSALKAFFRRRCSKFCNGDKSLLELSSVVQDVIKEINKQAQYAGAIPQDLSIAIEALFYVGAESEDQIGEFAHAIHEIRKRKCEAMTISDHNGSLIVSGLEPSGRFFTSIVNQELYDAATNAYYALVNLLGEEHAVKLITESSEIGGTVYASIFEKATALDAEARRGISITRLKGLGEMPAAELGHTTLDLATRTLIRVNVEDFDEAGNFIGQMMGKDEAAARRVIVQNAELSREEIDA